MFALYIIVLFLLKSHTEAWVCGSNARLLFFCYNPFNGFCMKCVCDNGYTLIADLCTNRNDPYYRMQKDLELERFRIRIELMGKENPNITIVPHIICPSNMVLVEHICPPSENWGPNCHLICKCRDGLRKIGDNCVIERKK
ncbi:unnamed protein product [Dracunculus medinensis]|uniref:Secreted protein n=1 Tax=Dracunculus medinensis TaxID=318479 RepID=A0A0N4U392_DRAME|nr:unnamed protein product [Dracunculus medinensis]